MPMLDGFLLSTFDRGLSIVDVDVDDPDTSDGVLVVETTSNLGRRLDEICRKVLGAAMPEGRGGVGTV